MSTFRSATSIPMHIPRIENILESNKEEREKFIETIKARIAQRFRSEDFTEPPQIDGRVKSIYSIYKKIFLHHKSIDEIYDKYAVRIIVTTIAECYNVLGLIHDMFRPLPNRFKDYISTPKANMYQSLHTTVLGTEGIPFEVQNSVHGQCTKLPSTVSRRIGSTKREFRARTKWSSVLRG